MDTNSRGLAPLLAVCISCIPTVILGLILQLGLIESIAACLLSFFSSFLFIWLILDFLFFKEINNIYGALDKLKNEKSSIVRFQKPSIIKPLGEIKKNIQNFAKTKEQEIDQLKKMESYRREFMADVSHELKTPIFAAQGFVHTLLDGALEDKKVRTKFLKKAAKSLDGLDILVQELLTISQMETGEIKMHFARFDIVELSREVFDQVDGKAEKKNVSLNLKRIAPIFVYADYQRIYQVMINLVVNAIKYNRKEGRVNIWFELHNSNVNIIVEDNGRGIPKNDIHRIFERFYRVEKSRSKEKGGIGLGLSIVKHIIEAHGSKINVMSDEKTGSKFSFQLRLQPLGMEKALIEGKVI